MPKITVELPAALQPLADGLSELMLEGEVVGEVLHALQAAYQPVGQRVLTRGGELRPHVHVFLDEEDIRQLDGLETAIKPHQRLVIVPSVAGG